MAAAALPIAGTVASHFLGQGAKNQAMQQSGQEKSAWTSQVNLSKLLEGQSRTLFTGGVPMIDTAAGYYQRLLSGNRGQMQEAVAPQAGMIREGYRGAESAVGRTARGGVRDLAMADIARQRAGQLGGLTMGVRNEAAEGIGRLGLGQVYPAVSAGAGAGSLTSGLLQNATYNRMQGNQVGQQTAEDVGSLLMRLVNALPAGGNKAGAGSSSTTYASRYGH